MTVESCQAACTCCDWHETSQTADVHAENHNRNTGHRVRLVLFAHV